MYEAFFVQLDALIEVLLEFIQLTAEAQILFLELRTREGLLGWEGGAACQDDAKA
jgi:hypothetical protein